MQSFPSPPCPFSFRSRFFLILVSLLVLMATAGCGRRAAARLDRGVALEAQGELLQAALSYISALERDASLAEARERLHAIIPHLGESWAAEAGALLEEGDPIGAAELTLVMDQIRDRGSGLGVTVPLPDDWERQRRQALDGGIEERLHQARGEAEAGRWPQGIQYLEEAMDRYAPTEEHATEIQMLWTDHLLAWSRADIEAGQPQAGFQRVEEARSLVSPGHPRLGEMAALQRRALELGTVSVAFLPVESTEQAREHAPAGFREALNELLQLEHWSIPPLFLYGVSPVEVRRQVDRVRREQLARGRRTTPLDGAVEVGRALGAQRAVITEVEAFTWDTTRVRLREVEAPLRGGGRDVYQVRSGTVRLGATVGYLIVDPERRRILDRRSFTTRTTAALQDGLYDGNPDDLDLPRRERLLFSRVEQEDREAAAVAELQDLLAERLAQEIYDRLLARIP